MDRYDISEEPVQTKKRGPIRVSLGVLTVCILLTALIIFFATYIALSSYYGRFSELIPTYEGEVVDTTAAGDAFTSALTLEYLRTKDIIRAVRYAHAVGTIVVGRAGASSSLPTAAEVDTFIRMRGIQL